MILRQTKALFIDAYRELNAKKLFWISIGISGLVVFSFALLGLRDGNFTIVGWRTSISLEAVSFLGFSLADIYKILFLQFGVNFWLAWVATILGLVSTAGLIPEFISSGSIDLALSKPIGRVRLYLTKFATGLTFTTLQVAVFVTMSFLVIGFRAGSWEPALFLAIPLVVLLFSYLYSICALLGLLTRSTIASLMLTLLVWFSIFIFNAADAALIGISAQAKTQTQSLDRALKRVDQRIADAKGEGEGGVLAQARNVSRLSNLEETRDEVAQELDDAQSSIVSLDRWHSRIVAAKTMLPKTTETVQLTRRALQRYADLPDLTQIGQDDGFTRKRTFGEGDAKVVVDTRIGGDEPDRQAQIVFDSRSLGWVLGTSLGFEAVMLALGCFIFTRRDF